MKTVLVTGSEGFTGENVVKTFKKQGYNVVGLVRRNPKKHEVACDLTDRTAIRDVIKKVKPHGVVHLAGLAFVGEANQEAFYTTHIFGTINILEALCQENISPEKVVIASSANVYGNPGDNILIDETVPPNPVNHYAASKLAMEYMVKNWFEKMPIIITRPFNYTGPEQNVNFLVPKIVDHFRRNQKEIELGNLYIAREFSDVRDVSSMYLKLYESTHRSTIVNLCSSKVYQLYDLIDYMNKIARYSISVKQNPAFMREHEIKILRGNNEKLYSMIDFTPQFTLMETLNDMYRR